MDCRRPRTRIQVVNPADGSVLYWLAKFYSLGTYTLVAAVLASGPAIFWSISAGVKNVPDLAALSQQTSLETHITTADGLVLAKMADERRYPITYAELPRVLIQAFLAAEDRKFFSHNGVDFRGILRAAWVNLRSGRVRQGASTITQQLAKSYLSPKRTFERKLKEIVLARRFEQRFSKQQILSAYLNRTYFGSRAYGVVAAARLYFGKALAELTTDEAALIAGLVRAPSRYSPRRNKERAKRRRDQVLRQMFGLAFIDAIALATALAEPIKLAPPRLFNPQPWLAPHFAEQVRRELVASYGQERVNAAGWRVSTTIDLPIHALARRSAQRSVRALDRRQGWRGPVVRARTKAEISEMARRLSELYPGSVRDDRPYLTLIDRVSASRALGRIGQHSVVLPLSLMRWAAPYSRTNADNGEEIESARDALRPGDVVWTQAPPRWMRGRGWGAANTRSTMVLGQTPRVEGAIYTYDYNNGYVLAMVGGLDPDRSSFNRCTQACRQPGSAYKPIFFSLALDSDKFSMGSILQDKPYQPEPGEEWNPQNVHGTLDGRVTMHYALVRSLNLPSIQLLRAVGADATARWARRLGFTTPIVADKALALGASCTRIDETTRAFATFARGGSQRDPIYVRQIKDRRGRTLVDHTSVHDPFLDESDRLDRLWAHSTAKDRPVIDRRTAFLITKLLRDSVLHGIAARCRIVPVPTAGKGGTSSDTMDTWFVGFTSQWATTAWMGDDSYQRPLGTKEASYTTVIPMWANYMKRAVADRPHVELPRQRPAGLHSTEIDLLNGGPPSPDRKSVRIYYRPGSFEPPISPSQDS